MWTLFYDRSSGGNMKEKWGQIYIEASKDEAKIIFYNRFGHNPERVSDVNDGEDYAINENESLEQLSAFFRGCKFQSGWLECPATGETGKYRARYRTLKDYLNDGGVLIIYAKDIKIAERQGEVPEQGYVWID